METTTLLTSFSRKSKAEKLSYISRTTKNPDLFISTLRSYWHSDPNVQTLLDEISENTLSNFPFPYGIAPNFLINGQLFHVPMVVEESSVVAAASNAAKFWLDRGGFRTKVLSTSKSGQVHFQWFGAPEVLLGRKEEILRILRVTTRDLTLNMTRRGGGITGMTIEKKEKVSPHYYCLNVDFETVDSMGANFINSCLEEMAASLVSFFQAEYPEDRFEILMSILSNYNPDCLVECIVECPVEQLFPEDKKRSHDFARRFGLAVRIAETDPFRATTHNKGIMNGVDAVVLATGNDFRAVEASAHAFASRNGMYSSLSDLEVTQGVFRYRIVLPLAIGTVGGLTSLHPLARLSLEILGNPSAPNLMQIVSAAGMANNFSAVRALTTQGIQKGHMKIHLSNILNALGASREEKNLAYKYFLNQNVSYHAVSDFLGSLRNGHE